MDCTISCAKVFEITDPMYNECVRECNTQKEQKIRDDLRNKVTYEAYLYDTQFHGSRRKYRSRGKYRSKRRHRSRGKYRSRRK